MSNSCWLPELEYLDDYQNNWQLYENALYSIFKTDFIDSRPSFEGKQVSIRRHPIEYNKEEAFFHLRFGRCDVLPLTAQRPRVWDS